MPSSAKTSWSWLTCLYSSSDGTIYINTPFPGIDQQQACHLELQCDAGFWTSYDVAGEPACEPPSNCTSGSFVVAEATATTDRDCQVCPNGTFSTGLNQQCTAWTECSLDATYEIVAPTSTSDRVSCLTWTRPDNPYRSLPLSRSAARAWTARAPSLCRLAHC